MGRMLLLGAGGIIAAVVALRVLGFIFGAALGIAAFLLFRVLPIILLGWLVMKVWKAIRPRPVG